MAKKNSNLRLSDEGFEPKGIKLKTNADRIRGMNDDELAICLYEIGYDEGWDKPEYALMWLQQPPEEG